MILSPVNWDVNNFTACSLAVVYRTVVIPGGELSLANA